MMLRFLECATVVAVFFGALRLATRFGGRARHRSWRRAVDTHHTPRHAAPEYLPRHEGDATGTPVVLGAYPDGDITRVHADPATAPAVRLADEPTVEGRTLIGASA